ncbi:MAG: hypothetical protein HY689_08790, partial [Chloroflexi bacterium]|nr:hypothetical protein [Chloroflexota bacterium]
DGILLLGVVFLLVLGRRPWRVSFALALTVTASYLALMWPWLMRSVALTGAPLPAAGVRTIWLRGYDDLYSFLDQPTLVAFLDWGVTNILWSRLAALVQNLGVFLGGAFHLAPFAALGLWHLRSAPAFRPFFVYAALLYLVHSLLFAFPGPRGSMLHSSVALLPWLALATLVGLDRAVAWVGTRLPHWNVPKAQQRFGLVALASAVLLSLVFTLRHIDTWGQDYRHYVELAAWVRASTPPEARLLVTNPPAFTYVSGRSSLATPSDSVEAVLAAADRYGATYLALESDHARPLDALYDGRATYARLEHLADVGLTRIYAVRPPGEGEGP